jgi:hypothetical protein
MEPAENFVEQATVVAGDVGGEDPQCLGGDR